MPSRPVAPDGQPDASRTLIWLRVLKLVLSIVLLAIGVVEAVTRLGLA